MILKPIKNNSCAIVVHIYKEKFNYVEEKSIENLFELLGNKYDIYAICPESLLLDNYQHFDFCAFIKTSDIYWTWPHGYNYLMLSSFIYEYFSEYKYMLIHHPDAWIFSDNLEEWIEKDYDIIGSPTFINMEDSFTYNVLLYYKLFKSKGAMPNGGLSLRKISWMIDNLKNITYSHLYDNVENRLDKNEKYNTIAYEDVYIITHFKINKYIKSIKENLKFAIPNVWTYKELFFIDYQIPFGIHPIISNSNNIIMDKRNFNFLKKLTNINKLHYDKFKL